MNIRLYHLELLSRWELFQLVTDLLTFTSNLEAEMPQTYTEKLEELQTAFNIYDIEIVQERKPSQQQILQAGAGRKYAIRKLYQLIHDYTNYRFDRNKEQAAKSLMRIFKNYGTGSEISRFNQDAQTAIITNLLQDLAEDDATQHLATLHLTDAVAALTNDNQTFENEQLTRKEYLSTYVTEY